MRNMLLEENTMKKNSPIISRPVPALCCCAAVILLMTGCNGKPSPPTLEIELFARGFTNPTACASPPDGSGRLFVTEQTGTVRVVDSSGELLREPFIDVSKKMVNPFFAYDESGLLGIVFHPDYVQNGRFFLLYNALPTVETPEGYHSNVRIAEYLVTPGDPNRADPASEQVLLDVPHPQSNHNGGQLAFGPDGYLYIGIGDGGNANDVGEGHTPDIGNGQDPTNLLGKMLRIDVAEPGVAAIPADNPFYDDPQKRGEIYAYGFRNPWRFSFDTGGSGRLFCGDVGQNLFEEINIVQAGGNYGWNIKEGLSCFNKERASVPLPDCPDSGADGAPLLDPVIAYGHPGSGGMVVGRSVVGGYVYRGAMIPELQGYYVFGDWSTNFARGDGSLFIADEDNAGAWQVQELSVQHEGRPGRKLNRFLLSFGEDEDGELYLLTSRSLGPAGASGEVYKIVGATLE
jgi:glucose/arabinose dehydrogenase